MKHRNTTEIAADNVAKADARLEAMHAAEEKRRRQVIDTAEYEAELWKRLDEQRAHAMHPDLQESSTSESSQAKHKLTITIKNKAVSSRMNPRHCYDLPY